MNHRILLFSLIHFFVVYSGSIHDITSSQDWHRILAADEVHIIKVYHEYCSTCIEFEEHFEALATEYGEEFKFAKMSIQELGDVADELGVKNSLPTVFASVSQSTEDGVLKIEGVDNL